MDLNTLRLPDVPADIPHGDMPGDRICITEDHIKKAGIIFPRLLEKLSALPDRRKVIAVCGGSGVGKSEIASVLAYISTAPGPALMCSAGITIRAVFRGTMIWNACACTGKAGWPASGSMI